MKKKKKSQTVLRVLLNSLVSRECINECNKNPNGGNRVDNLTRCNCHVYERLAIISSMSNLFLRGKPVCRFAEIVPESSHYNSRIGGNLSRAVIERNFAGSIIAV